MKTLGILLSILLLASCASTPSNLPSNIEVEKGAMNASYIKHVYFDYPSDRPISFEKARQCVALHIDNKPQIIKDSSRSWVGPYTGNYYRGGNTAVVGGGQVINTSSNELQSIVASGNTKYSTGLTSDIVQFKMILSLNETGSRVSFVNIERAQKNTGMLENSGFSPVGVWTGSRYKQVYAELERLAAEINICHF